MKTEQQTTGIIPDASLRPARTAEADAAERTPNPTWAAWALIDEARKGNALAQTLCIDQLELITGCLKPAPKMFVVTTNCGYWGRGSTPSEAAKTALKVGARKSSMVFLNLVVNDETPEVNQGGMLITEGNSTTFSIGSVRTLGALIVE
jgi:hypothetical protein